MKLLYYEDYKNFDHPTFVDKMYELMVNKTLNDMSSRHGIIIENFDYNFQDWCLFSMAVQCAGILNKKLIIKVKRKRPYYIHKMKKYNEFFEITTKPIPNEEEYLVLNSLMLHDYYYYDNILTQPDLNRSPFIAQEFSTILNLSLYMNVPKIILKKLSRLPILAFYDNYKEMEHKELI